MRTANPDAATFCIEVIDTGIGIAAETLPKIFNAFEQGDSHINKAFGGLGLGLAISQALAQLHGGTLRAESDGAGKGATFIFSLPAHAGVAATSRTVPTRSDEAKRRRILLVEDHAATAALMARLLRKRGHTSCSRIQKPRLSLPDMLRNSTSSSAISVYPMEMATKS